MQRKILNSNFRRVLHCVLLSAAVFAFCGASDPSARFAKMGHQLMCTCGCGQILLECNHVGCTYSDRMRNELVAALTRGDSDSIVQQSFLQKYGPTVLAAPTRTGFDRTAWIMPFVSFVLGFTLVIYVLHAWKNRPAPAIPGRSPLVRRAELEPFRTQADKETEI